MPYSLGVDLGTTFVAAAVARSSAAEMVSLANQGVVTPAVAYLREDGVIVTGDAASRRSVTDPDRAAREFKRNLGDPIPLRLGTVSVTAAELLGAVLRDVLHQVCDLEGEAPERVALSYPANWGSYRRSLFTEVSGFAGVACETVTITEPEAAAAHYAASRRLQEGQIVAVYDLGGGTFDATIMRGCANGVEILGRPEGIGRLGGVDFDEAIMSHVNYTLGGALRNVNLKDAEFALSIARVRQECVQAKESLSHDTETTIPVFLPGKLVKVSLTRESFEDMIRASVESTIVSLISTISSANLKPSDLSAVLLVGGSSRIPLVAEMVSRELGCKTVVDAHPKHAVALGAAISALEVPSTRATWQPIPLQSSSEPVPPVAHLVPASPGPASPGSASPGAASPGAVSPGPAFSESEPPLPATDATTGPGAGTPEPYEQWATVHPRSPEESGYTQPTDPASTTGKSRGRWIALIILVALGFGVGVAAWAIQPSGADKPELLLSKPQVRIGDTYFAVAKGFNAGESVHLSWSGPTTGMMAMTDGNAADPAGSRREGPILEQDPAGDYTITAVGLASGLTASAKLTVLPADTPH